MLKNKFLSIVSAEEIPEASTTLLSTIELYNISLQMQDICKKINGRNLHATQVGIPINLFIVFANNEWNTFKDCIYEGVGEKVDSLEMCLSLKNNFGSLRSFQCQRFRKIKFAGSQLQTKNNRIEFSEFSMEVDGLLSIILQHEVDHSCGKVKMIDRIGHEIELR